MWEGCGEHPSASLRLRVNHTPPNASDRMKGVDAAGRFAYRENNAATASLIRPRSLNVRSARP